PHPAIATIQGQEPCVVVGYNDVRPRDGAEVLIQGYRLRVAPLRGGPALISTTAGTRLERGARLLASGPSASLERAPTPMLSVWESVRERGRVRFAAFAH